MIPTTQGTAATGPAQGEALAVWSLIGLVLAAIFVTYWRLPAADLYNTSVEGLGGGAGRVLVLVAVSALPTSAWWIAAPSIGLCLVTAWPGQVKQSDLDARAVNVIPALGVALA